jgi:hypothetical protein
MSELPTSPEHHPLRPTLEGAAQTTLTVNRLDELLAWNWKAARATMATAA